MEDGSIKDISLVMREGGVMRSVPKDCWDAAEARQAILTKRPTSF